MQVRKGDKMMEIKEILLVDAKAPINLAFSFILASNGYLIAIAPDVETAWEEMDNYHFDLIIIYLNGYESEKIHFLQLLKRKAPQQKVMAIGNPRNNMLPLEVFQLELDDYLLLPFDAGDLCRRVAGCLEKNDIAPPAGFIARKMRKERGRFNLLDLRSL
jgi:DNA-binding response OmpR family regulator